MTEIERLKQSNAELLNALEALLRELKAGFVSSYYVEMAEDAISNATRGER